MAYDIIVVCWSICSYLVDLSTADDKMLPGLAEARSSRDMSKGDLSASITLTLIPSGVWLLVAHLAHLVYHHLLLEELELSQDLGP